MKPEVSMTLKIKPADLKRLEQAGKYGVRNALKTVSQFALLPARDQARRLSGVGVGRAKKTFGTGLRGVGTTYNIGKGKQRKVRRYRAGVSKSGAYSMRGRADSGGAVTLLFSIKTNADYYNFVSNFWEHGWRVGNTKKPGNQFMTKAVQGNLSAIGSRFARAIGKAVQVSPRRLKTSDLKGML